MKKVFLFSLFLSISYVLFAQDVIVKKDGTTILSQVVKLSESEIEYKKWSNKTGPTYVIKTEQVLSINYQNGEKEVFDSSANGKSTNKVSQQNANLIEGNVIDLSGGNNVDIADPYNQIYGRNSTVDAINQMSQSNYQLEIERLRRKAKTWRTAGYIFWFGVGIGGGIAVGGFVDEVAGYATLAGGMAIGIYCIFKQGSLIRSANSLERRMKMNNVNISCIFEKEIQNSGLKAGLAMMNNGSHKNALGLNLSYNF